MCGLLGKAHTVRRGALPGSPSRSIDMEVKNRTFDPCSSDLHEEHLCYIVSQALHLTEKSDYDALVDEPSFHCDHCGREANRSSNLCRPVDL
jgi:hypothetical protein